MIALSSGCVWVGGFDSQLRASFTYFGQLLRCAYKCIVNIMKVYIERNNIQVELIRFRKKYRLYSCLRLRGERVPEPLYVYSLFATLTGNIPHHATITYMCTGVYV